MGWLVLLCAVGPPTLRGVDAHGDPMPAGAMMRLGTPRWRGPYPHAVYSPDGSAIAVLSGNSVTGYDRRTGRPLVTVQGRGRVWGAAFTDGGKRLTVHSAIYHRGRLGDTFSGHWVEIHDWPSGKSAWVLAINSGAGDGQMLRLSPDGQTIATWSSRDERHLTLNRFKARSPLTQLGLLTRPERGFRLVRFAPDSRRVVVSTEGNELRLFDGSDGASRRLAVGGEHPHHDIAASPDGSAVVAVTDAELVRYDGTTGRATRRAGSGWAAAYSPDGRRLAWARPDGIHLLDPLTLRTLAVLGPGRDRYVASVTFSPDGRELSVGSGHLLARYDVTTGRRLDAGEGHGDPIQAVAFSPDGRRLATGDAGGEVRIWDVAAGRTVRRLEAGEAVSALAFSPDGARLAAGEGYSHGPAAYRAVHVWDAAGTRTVRFTAHLRHINGLAFTPDGRTLVTAGQDDRVRWWDAATGDRVGEQRHLGRPHLIGFDGGRVLVHTLNGEVAARAPGEAARVIAPPSEGYSLHASFGGGRVLVQTTEKCRFHDVRTGVAVGPKLDYPVNGPGPLALSPDAELMLHRRGNQDTPIALYDLAVGRDVATLPARGHQPAVAFSPCGRWAAVGDDTTVLLFDVREMQAKHLLGGWLADSGASAALIAGRPDGLAALIARLDHAADAERRARRIIPGLAADDFAGRERAQRELAALGPAAAPALGSAAEASSELEIRLRCRRLLAALPAGEQERWSGPGRLTEAMGLMVRHRWLGVEAAMRGLLRRHPDAMPGAAARAALGGKP